MERQVVRQGVGVMQVIRPWRFVEDVLLGHADVRRTARGNIRVGILYLRYLLREFGGSKRLALAAYYQGPRAVAGTVSTGDPGLRPHGSRAPEASESKSLLARARDRDDRPDGR